MSAPLVRGIVIGTQNLDEAVVRLASEAEARALAAGPPDVGLLPMVPGARPPAHRIIGADLFVWVEGQYHPVGVCSGLDYSVSPIDVSSHGSGPLSIPGLCRITGRFEGTW